MRLVSVTSQLSVSRIFPPRKKEQSTGMSVRDSASAPPRASITTTAIGLNIFPSMPCNASTGTYTTVMMATPKNIGRATSRALTSTSCIRSAGVSSRPR
jgi:hypothetical protein